MIWIIWLQEKSCNAVAVDLFSFASDFYRFSLKYAIHCKQSIADWLIIIIRYDTIEFNISSFHSISIIIYNVQFSGNILCIQIDYFFNFIVHCLCSQMFQVWWVCLHKIILQSTVKCIFDLYFVFVCRIQIKIVSFSANILIRFSNRTPSCKILVLYAISINSKLNE